MARLSPKGRSRKRGMKPASPPKKKEKKGEND